MTAPDGAAFLLGVNALWLLLLTFGVVVVRREASILKRRLDTVGRAIPDGLEVGAPVPASAHPRENRVVVFLYADCEPCHELVPDLASISHPDRVEVVIGTGTSTPGAGLAMSATIPAPVSVVSEAEADRLIETFKVNSAPLGVATRDGVVVAKGYIRSGREIDYLLGEVVSV